LKSLYDAVEQEEKIETSIIAKEVEIHFYLYAIEYG